MKKITENSEGLLLRTSFGTWCFFQHFSVKDHGNSDFTKTPLAAYVEKEILVQKIGCLQNFEKNSWAKYIASQNLQRWTPVFYMHISAKENLVHWRLKVWFEPTCQVWYPSIHQFMTLWIWTQSNILTFQTTCLEKQILKSETKLGESYWIPLL